MEEDIKILENVLKTKQYGLLEVTDTFYEALENLLTRYKQLEEENKKKDKRLNRQFKLLQKKDKETEEWQRAYQEEKDKQFELLRDKDSIPKSKVKEKIEELRERENNCQQGIVDTAIILDCRTQIKVLKELLKED